MKDTDAYLGFLAENVIFCELNIFFLITTA